jgi:hypothetical protein
MSPTSSLALWGWSVIFDEVSEIYVVKCNLQGRGYIILNNAWLVA